MRYPGDGAARAMVIGLVLSLSGLDVGGAASGADAVSGGSAALSGQAAATAAELCPPERRWRPKEQVVRVTAKGEFVPAVTCVIPGDTVVWRFEGNRYVQSIIPVREPERGDVPADACTAYLPYDPNDPNDFTGPMPEAASGLFSRADDEQGLLANGEKGACGRVCEADPGEFCAGKKIDDTRRRILRGACYEQGLTCEPEGLLPFCEVDNREPGNFYYTNHHTTWTNAAVTGVLLVFDWQDLEPEKGRYDWRDLDRTVQQAVDHGKLFSLAIKAGSTRTGLPPWMFEPEPAGMGMEPLEFYAKYGGGLTCGEAENHLRVQAHVLDHRFRERYNGILRAVGDHLREKNAHYRALAYVKPSGANLQSPENHLPKGCLEEESGVSPEGCACMAEKLRTMTRDAAVALCARAYGDQVNCCGYCNERIWETARYYESETDSRGAVYSAAKLVEFYSEQTAKMAAYFPAFPGKSMTYALIQDGFPTQGIPQDAAEVWAERGVPAGGGGMWPTYETIWRGGQEHGVRFVVQHNAIDSKPDLDPWLRYQLLLRAPAGRFQDYLAAGGGVPEWLKAEENRPFRAWLAARWVEDRARLTADPTHTPLSAEEYFDQMTAMDVKYRDPCLLPGEQTHTHPKTLAHYNRYFGRRGQCANPQVILAGAMGQITGKQNPNDLKFTAEFVSSLDNAYEHTDAIFLETYEWVIQRAMADGYDLRPKVERFHERRRSHWNQWAADPVRGWIDRELATEPFPEEHRHTFGAPPAGESKAVFHYVHGSECAANPRVGKVILKTRLAAATAR